MRFGGTTITFVTVTEDTDNRDRYGNPEPIRTEVDVPGSHWRPVRSDEKTTTTGTIATEQWKATCPPVAAALNAKPSDELKVDGITFQIVGPVRPSRDLDGRYSHVSITAQRVDG